MANLQNKVFLRRRSLQVHTDVVHENMHESIQENLIVLHIRKVSL